MNLFLTSNCSCGCSFNPVDGDGFGVSIFNESKFFMCQRGKGKGARVGQTFDSPLKERRIGFVAVVGPHRKSARRGGGAGKIHLMELVFYSELAVSKSAEKKSFSLSIQRVCTTYTDIWNLFEREMDFW